jgi:DNA modification methylase
VSLPKPYYEEPGITIYHGDCRNILPHLEPVDLVLTDPPYAIPTVVAQSRIWTRNIGDLNICESYFRDWMKDLRKCLSDDGRIFMFCNQTSYPVIFRSFYGDFNIHLLIWDKGKIGMGSDFRKTFELILYGYSINVKPLEKDGIGHSDILRFMPVPSMGRKHPAEKPIDLLTNIISRFAKNTILDPFMGSGTTLRAAKDLGRKAIGIEIEEKYCAIAVERLRQGVLI